MPTNSRAFLKPFIGGLNTELSQVEDAVTFTSDELNCTILPEGIRGRRYGMNIERDGSWYQLSKAGTTYSGFFWKNVGKTEKDFVVVSVDATLHFYDAFQKPFSNAKLKHVVDLSEHIIDSNRFVQNPVKFTTGNGTLIVVSKYLKPIQISYDDATTSFKVETFDLKVRDIVGIDDGLEVDEMPLELTEKHKYNLFNQGWNQEAIDEFFKSKQMYPSNNLKWFYGIPESSAETLQYDVEKLLREYVGNTPAPRGHYVLDYFNRNRSVTSGLPAEGDKTITINYSYISSIADVWYGAYGIEFDRPGDPDNLVKKFNISFSNVVGVVKNFNVTFPTMYDMRAADSFFTWSGKVIFRVKGDNTELYNETHDIMGGRKDGEQAYPDSTTFNLVFNEEGTTYTDYTIEIEWVSGEFDAGGVPHSMRPTNVNCVIEGIVSQGGSFETSEEQEFSQSRITDVAFMAGRYFFLAGDTVLFSQTIKEDGTGIDKCYQDADPTSKDVSDVLPTDGGYVKFQTMGDGLALKTFNRGVLVFGRDIVHGLISPLESRFTATEYDILELSKAGLIGPESVVSVSDRVFYWSPLGIFAIGTSQLTGNTMVAESVSEGTIQTYYNNIPNESKKYCKGAYDYVNNRIYWFYPTDTNKLAVLDGCLVYDLSYNAFYPLKISSQSAHVTCLFDSLNSYQIRPTMYVRAGGYRVVAGGRNVIAAEETNTKYNRWTALQHCIIDKDNKISFGDFNSREFIDWDSESYDSYMITRPITLNDTYFNKQTPVLQTLFKRTEEIELNQRVKNIELLSKFYLGHPEYNMAGKRYECTLNNLNTDTGKPLNYSIKLNSISNIVAGANTPITELKNCTITLWRVDRNGLYPQHKQTIKTLKVGEPLIIPCTNGEYGTDFEISIYIPEQDNHRIGERTFINFDANIVMESNIPVVNDKQYVAQSGAYIRMRWGWSLTDKSNRWDMIQNAYRPQKDFMEDEYIESRMHVKGRGKSFQIEIRNDKNKDFRLGGMNIIVRSR